MSYNDLGAKDDPNLKISVYYLRPNAFKDLMSPYGGLLFANTWEKMAGSEMAGFRRGSMAGALVSDFVRALQLEEVTNNLNPHHGWFVHSGVTRYEPTSSLRVRSARIDLPDGRSIVGSVRDECNVTSTALANMVGDDDVSFVLGRVLSDSKFDLVAAGYRSVLMANVSSRTNISLVENMNVLQAAASTRGDEFSYQMQQTERKIDEPTTLSIVMLDMCDHFARVVQSEGGWRHLYDGSKPTHESRHQGMFRLLTRMSFGSYGINVEPGADHGRGPTDFTLSLGSAKHIVEFKKDADRTKTLHGLSIQLPLYMDSAGASKGSFIVMCHNNDPEVVRSWIEDCYDPSKIFVSIVDARPQASASKA